MIEELRAEGTTISTSIADHIESFTDYDFAHLLFSDGDVTQSISLEKQLNIIQVANLVLPDKETSFEEYTTMELLSVAMLIVISTFALDFIHTDRSVFKIVDLDEAWSFLQVAQGKTLSMKLVRAGRAMNAGVYFVTQNTDDLLDEKLKKQSGLEVCIPLHGHQRNQEDPRLFSGWIPKMKTTRSGSVTWKTDSALSVICTGVWE